MYKMKRGQNYCPRCGYQGTGDCGCSPLKEENKSWQSKYDIENLIFEGGGVKSIGYGSALIVMDSFELLKNVKRVGGTSAGAITACLMALGYTPREIAGIIVNTKFSSFQDDSFGVIRDTYRLVKNYGWHKGDTFKEWLGGYVTKKFSRSDLTFSGLSRLGQNRNCKDLYIVVTNLTKQKTEVYSAETTPNMSIVDAVRISMSIPIFFQCVKNEEEDILVDGGVACNFPIRLFDKEKYMYPGTIHQPNGYMVNLKTIGFRLDTKEEIEAGAEGKNIPAKIDNISQYVRAIVTFLMEKADKGHLKDYDRKRTIFIETGDVKATDFNLSEESIQMLLKNGERAVYDYFNCKPLF